MGTTTAVVLPQIIAPPSVFSLPTSPGPLSFRHLVSTQQITRPDIDTIFATADEMAALLKRRPRTRCDIGQGRVVASLFYEESTRTRLSSEVAAARLGASVVNAVGIEFSSFAKGESLRDGFRVIGGYPDMILMRHPVRGSAAVAASVCRVPLINCGDGDGEHPTQACLDAYTIRSERGQVDGVDIALVGDNRFSRTAHSLVYLLTLFPGVRFTFVNHPELAIPDEVKAYLRERGVPFQETDELDAALDHSVIYIQRVQKKRFVGRMRLYNRVRAKYILTRKHLEGRRAIVMHPLPRTVELSTDVDDLPNNAIFRQSDNGVPVRMAIENLLWQGADMLEELEAA